MEGSHKTVDEAESRSKAPDSVPIVDVEDEKEEVAKNKGGYKTSWVWQHFDQKAIKKGVEKIKCPYCPQMMCENSKKNGTSAMGNHLKLYCTKSPVYNPSLGKSGDSKKQSVLSFKKGESGDSYLTAYSFNQDKCRKSLAHMCIKDNQPFSIVDDEGFREYSWDLQPMFKLPSRWTVANELGSGEVIEINDD
ncbi:hypothetical protein LXL04_016295 [Taraxacum kok-saghyz]